MVVNISKLSNFNTDNIHIYAHNPTEQTYTKLEPSDYANVLKSSPTPELTAMYATDGQKPQIMRLALKPVNVKFLCEQFTKAKKFGSAGVWGAGNMVKHIKPVLTIEIGSKLFPEQFETVSRIISRLNNLISASNGALSPINDVYSNKYGYKILKPVLKTYWTDDDHEGDKRPIKTTCVRDIKSNDEVIFEFRHNKKTPYTEEDWNNLYAKDIIQEKDGPNKPLYGGKVEIEFKSINLSSDSNKSSTLSMNLLKVWLMPKAAQKTQEPLPDNEWDEIDDFNKLSCNDTPDA